MSKKKKIILFISLPILAIITVNYLPYKIQRKLGLNPALTCYVSENSQKYELVQAKVLAHYLARGGFGKCLVIHEPLSNWDKSLDELVEGFRIGFGGFVTEIVTEPIKNINMNGVPYPEEAKTEMTADDFNKVIKKHPDCDIIICMVPLPFSEDELYKIDIFKMIDDPENPGLWIKDPKQRYPRLGLYNGYVGNLEPLFRETLIAAMTIWRPNPVIEQKPISKNLAEAFYSRYLIIAPEFLDRSIERYPALFPPRRR